MKDTEIDKWVKRKHNKKSLQYLPQRVVWQTVPKLMKNYVVSLTNPVILLPDLTNIYQYLNIKGLLCINSGWLVNVLLRNPKPSAISKHLSYTQICLPAHYVMELIILFTELAPLGLFSHRVAMSVFLSVSYLLVCLLGP